MKCPICLQTGFRGQQGVNMHIGRVHTKTINPNRESSIKKRRMNRLARKEGQVAAVDGEPGVAIVVARTKRISASSKIMETLLEGDEPKNGSNKFEVNGCPNCLFPLSVMNNELAKHEIQPPPFCPGCTFPVEVVRTAIRLSNKHKPADLITA